MLTTNFVKACDVWRARRGIFHVSFTLNFTHRLSILSTSDVKISINWIGLDQLTSMKVHQVKKGDNLESGESVTNLVE